MKQCLLSHCTLYSKPPKLQTQEELSQLLPSQWGMVDLFDLCLWFGHVDTALALAMRGVEGCVLEDHHLGPFSRDSSVRRGSCYCQGRDTCRYCCWAFPVDQGIWMEDWDVDLFDFNDEGEPTLGAIPAAREAEATPVHPCRSGHVQP